MENVLKRHWNATIVTAVLFVQMMGLAYQVKRPTEHGPIRLIRLWAVSAITPFEKIFVHSVDWTSNVWHNYVYLRNVRQQNDQLREEIQRLRLEQVRLTQDANQARRLQSLLGFKEQYISETMAAQVISSTGSEFTRGVYIDKGSRDGIKRDMPVITADGVVGKVYAVFPSSSLVLEISDPSSGAGVILEKSRLQGVLKGDQRGTGETYVNNIMADEKIELGDVVVTSGGDRVFPKGLPVGRVESVVPGSESFLSIRVHPAALLDRLEEVLVITKIVEKAPVANVAGTTPIRAADILAQRLPTVEPPKPSGKGTAPPTTGELAAREKAARKAAQQDAASASPPAGDQPAAPNSAPVVPQATKPAANSDKPVSATPVTQVPKPPANSPAADKPKTNSGPDNSTKEPPH
jgi:rod shape-determining protein MreC